MKIDIEMCIKITGLVSDVDKRITHKDITIIARVHFPAVPRIGEELRFCDSVSDHPLSAGTVKYVGWDMNPRKKNVLEPYLFLEDWHPNEGKEADELKTLQEEMDSFVKWVNQPVKIGEVQFTVKSEPAKKK